MDRATSDLLERARHYVKLDRSKFIRQSVREKAETVIAKYEKTHFTAEDWTAFFDMLDHPATPTDRMKRAVGKYRIITSSDAV